MKILHLILGLLFPVAGLILLGIWAGGNFSDSKLLGVSLLCTNAGLWTNLYFQRRNRQNAEKDKE
jgi:hypothetical protein